MEQKTFSFNKFLHEELNPQQKEAVLHDAGSLLVIAGAGSGKTRVITARITNLLIEKDIHPAQLVALTFTNKAANEMKERIIKFLGSDNKIPFIGTFHSYCLYLLKTNRHLLPFDTFSILDEDDKRALFTKLVKQSPLYKKVTPQSISYQLSKLKNQVADPRESVLDLVDNPQIKDVIAAYEKEKKASKCFDFDDLLIEATKLLYNPEIRDAHHNQVRHILIDEYQDTNLIQHTLLKQMGLDVHNNHAIDSLCVVGDEDQSIYSWRGATVDNIVHFQKDFKDTKLIKIEQNYRSKKPILHIANTVITHNKKRNEKKLWSTREGNDCVRALQCLSGYQEADIIARYCKILHDNKKLGSTALLYRTHFQSRILEEALLRHGLNYMIIGGIRFYERKEIKDIIAYLRLIVNPYDRVAWMRIINCPSRGLGDKFQEQFLQYWDDNPFLNFKEISNKLLTEEHITGVKADSVRSFLNSYTELFTDSPAIEALTTLIEKNSYIAYLRDTCEKQEASERQENIKELLNAAHFFSSQGKNTVAHFLDEVALLQEKADIEQVKEEGVLLMTIHAAKGLEFNNVIIAGLEENLFPSGRSIDDIASLEEERRLFYVALTRAKNSLLLTSARYRQTYGSMEQQVASRFLDEIPTSSCNFAQTHNWQQHEVTTFFNQWLGTTPTRDVFTFSSFIPEKIKTKISQQPTTVLSKKSLIPTCDSVTNKKTVHAQTIQTTATEPQILSGKSFKKHQTVKHKVFGVGIVKEIEQKQTKTFITAHFKVGLKKIESSFLEKA